MSFVFFPFYRFKVPLCYTSGAFVPGPKIGKEKAKISILATISNEPVRDSEYICAVGLTAHARCCNGDTEPAERGVWWQQHLCNQSDEKTSNHMG